ncbi:metallophosphoesterase [Solirubrobacter phytolaccae]|uniref:Metallophosphoesterase n=1 Tax=Solirubrobacter phytolaccae TaxID=1404360 RepID=A0A9X3N3H2_9ACTN|nr:LamG-like jellyroll fold domain-containing protein [Solirubrobacter phytolaccae]MDA0179140.1 metallophosphoesterase [Solirubrobacter phytolaccae]
MTRPVRAAAALSFVLTLLVAVAVNAQTGGGASAPSFDPTSHRFTIAVVPDTQYLFDDDRGDTEPVAAAFDWMVENRERENIAFAAGLGDVTQDGLQNEVDRADHAYKILDRAKLPYSVLAGNHDINSGTNDTRGETPFSKAFGPQRYTGMPTYLGSSANGYNSAHKFTAGGRQWLILALDWRLSTAGTAWAQSVLDANKTVPTIVTTHETLSSNAEGNASLTSYGTTLWNNLIRKNDQIVLSLSGHNWPVGRVTQKNDFGHDVYLNLADYQDMYYGGAGMIRTYQFDLDRDTIDVETFSPWILAQNEADRSLHERLMMEKTEPQSRFSIPLDFKALAQRLDPKPAPAEVATDALKVPGTVALWRPTGTGTVTKLDDLSGNGNDLTPTTLASSTGEQAQISVNEDHGDDQPSARSLKFTANKSQRRGTYLRTADGAPLNTNEFKNGYTIEAFVKLPASCCNSNSWMGILGQQGTGRDLGRTKDDPDESAIALALSGGAELQWAVWPTNTDRNITAWGHGMASQRWTHVAAVNDGRYTDLYIDGALMGRNPLSPAIGLGSTGKYWMLGATDYANVVEQTFNGLIGDVRIVDHALPATKFMNAARTPVTSEATTATLTGRTIEVAVTGAATTAATQVVEPHTGDRFDLGTATVTDGKARFPISDLQHAALGDGARVEVALDGKPNATLHLRADGKPVQPTATDTKPSTAGGTVPATLSLTLAGTPTFGAFTPGVTKEYTAQTKATVVSTAADATLSVSEPGHLANGAFSLPEPLRVELAKTSWNAPTTNEDVDIAFKQLVKDTDALRTGAYTRSLTFTLATSTP